MATQGAKVTTENIRKGKKETDGREKLEKKEKIKKKSKEKRLASILERQVKAKRQQTVKTIT
jgi:hypothetical protein